MRRVISQLDIRRAQVLVEALIVEVSGDIAEDIGVTWITNPENEYVAAVNTLGDLPLARPNISDGGVGFSPGRGFTFGYFNNGDIQAAIRILSATQNANILSTPTIVAIDNEEASLLVGQNVPFKTGQSTGSASSTNDPFTTIERQDIGISLVVTPRINQGDSITLEIKQKTETIAPSVETASDIITNKREIITKALIKDDQILVLGGLISDEETEVREKVPFLGDLPLIGKLFSSTGKSHSKKNLMVFIHPIILKDDEHIKQITQRRYNFMKGLQQQVRDKQWQIDPEDTAVMEDFRTFTPVNEGAKN
jgi:general secretion pathway protein D